LDAPETGIVRVCARLSEVRFEEQAEAVAGSGFGGTDGVGWEGLVWCLLERY